MPHPIEGQTCPDTKTFCEDGMCLRTGCRLVNKRESPAPGAPLNKGNARQRPGILGARTRRERLTVWEPAGPYLTQQEMQEGK